MWDDSEEDLYEQWFHEIAEDMQFKYTCCLLGGPVPLESDEHRKSGWILALLTLKNCHHR